MHLLGGRGPPMWVLFGENVCKNERIGFHGGRAPGTPPPRSANVIVSSEQLLSTDDTVCAHTSVCATSAI